MSTFVNPILTFINRCPITVFSKQGGVNSKPCMTRFPHIAAALCGLLFVTGCQKEETPAEKASAGLSAAADSAKKAASDAADSAKKAATDAKKAAEKAAANAQK